jgi:hypothetical protein
MAGDGGSFGAAGLLSDLMIGAVNAVVQLAGAVVEH